MSRRHSRPQPFDPAGYVNAGFVVALAAVALFAAWPVYRTPYLFLTVGGAVVLAAAIAFGARLLRRSWLTQALAVVVAFLVFGVPLAVPRAFGSRADLLTGFRELVAAAVFGWKQLVTVAVPVGHYGTLLVPALVTVLVCATVGFNVALRARRAYPVVVPVMLVPVAFALAFGSSAMSAPLNGTLLGHGWHIAAPRELLVGALALAVSAGFLVWRAQHARAVALTAAAAATGVRRSGGTARRLRRAAAAVAVAIVALAVAVPVASTALVPVRREVLRSTIDPLPTLHDQTSPLTTYRTAFDAAGLNTPWLTVSGDLARIGRVRLATLSHYNGQQFTVLSSQADTSDAFAHIPQLTASPHGSGLATATVTIGDYDKVWLPTAAGLVAVGFSGSGAPALTDGFYYNTAAQAGVELNPLAKGDAYTIVARPAAKTPSLSAAVAPAGFVPPSDDLPKSLSAWVAAQKLGSDGGSLAQLIDRLRARGYLSHSLDDPGTGPDSWVTAVRSPAFQASPAGESVDRIDALFSSLLTRQQNAAAGGDDALVAAVGDDEQFATAGALLAESLGFPARVVLGFALVPDETDAAAVPACDDGVCRGRNLTAWIEVQSADGAWIPVVTTPQHTVQPAKDDTTQREPQHDTVVQQRGVKVLTPPEANPTGSEQHSKPQQDDRRTAVEKATPYLRVGGTILLILLVLAAPLASVLGVKAARRRERRHAASVAERMAAGWDEFVDEAVDLGLPRQGSRTRTETALLYAAAVRTGDPVRLRTLASGADEAVFGAVDPSEQAARAYWAALDEEHARLAAAFPWWKRLAARLSVRSFGRVKGQER